MKIITKISIITGFMCANTLFSAEYFVPETYFAPGDFKALTVYVQNESGADLQVKIIDEDNEGKQDLGKFIPAGDTSIYKIGNVDNTHSLIYEYTGAKGAVYPYKVTWREISAEGPSVLVTISSYRVPLKLSWEFKHTITNYEGAPIPASTHAFWSGTPAEEINEWLNRRLAAAPNQAPVQEASEKKLHDEVRQQAADSERKAAIARSMQAWQDKTLRERQRPLSQR